MTKPTLSCERFALSLADFLERDVDESERARMESHALSCDECGPLLADLRSLRIDAANLPELAPSHDLWAGIAARIETPVVALAPAGGTLEKWNGGRRRHATPLWFGLVAAGLVAVTATVTRELTKRAMAPASVATVAVKPVVSPDTDKKGQTVAPSPATPSKDSVLRTKPTAGPALRLASAPRSSAEQTYDSEIARLRTVVNRRRGQLDSGTVATIERNLIVIDSAIVQCKQALRKDPASQFLMESLNDAMDNKVQLLRTAASLPTRS